MKRENQAGGRYDWIWGLTPVMILVYMFASLSFSRSHQIFADRPVGGAPNLVLLAFSLGLALLGIHWVSQIIVIRLPRRKYALPMIMAPGLLWGALDLTRLPAGNGSLADMLQCLFIAL